MAQFGDKDDQKLKSTEIVQSENELQIGRVKCPIKPAVEPKKVPAPLFYHNDAQDAVLESLLSDWMLGEHLLLVGNQVSFFFHLS